MWTEGYVSEIDYTYGYYPEMAPARVRLACRLAGVEPPAIETACELGFGQGLSTNIHAAANPEVAWWGTDFNPSQAAFARELSKFSGARLFDQSFSEFAARRDLPQFEFICLHGIWSWISAENRDVIAAFARQSLDIGGSLYVSYNCLPGWAPVMPLRQLLTYHGKVMAPPGEGIVTRTEAALAFVKKLFDTKPAYVRQNPVVVERLKGIAGASKNYLAHEYLNEDWHIATFTEIVQQLAECKLSFACSADLREMIPEIMYTPEQLKLLKEIPDETFRVQVQDYMLNQQFRRDYFVRGRRRLARSAREQALRGQRLLLGKAPHEVEYKVRGPIGEVSFKESLYKPIVEALSDFRVHSIDELARQLCTEKLQFAQLAQALTLLFSINVLVPAKDADQEIEAAQASCQALNTELLERARRGGEITYLASPVTGMGVALSRFQQLFLLALRTGARSAHEIARYAATMLRAEGERLLKDGAAISSQEETVAEFEKQAGVFLKTRWPIVKAMGVA